MKLLSIYSTVVLLIGAFFINRANPEEQDYIYYSTEVNSRGRDIIRANANGGSRIKLTAYNGSGHYPHYNAPKVSPDGRKIVYQSDIDGHDRYTLWVMDIDGKNAKKITRREGMFPNWSPDSRAIIFSGRRNGVWELLTITTTGEEEKNITENYRKSKKPSWGATASYHPNGKSIIYSYIREKKLYVMDLESKEIHQLGVEGESYTHPVFSRNGDRIAVNRKQVDAYDLVTMLPDGSDIKVIVENVISYSTPSWSKSGEELLFTGVADRNQEIFKINLKSGKETRLTKNNGFDAMPTW